MSAGARYWRVVLDLPREREEVITAELWEQGTLGIELVERDAGIRVIGWFREPGPSASDEESRRSWRLLGAEMVASEAVLPTDWMARYRWLSRPFAVGRGLIVDPREPSAGPLEGGARRLLRLPARAAFGTGSHESTRLAVELLEETPLRGRRVVDVGTGTGILAFVAMIGGAERVVGLDVSIAAGLLAGQNCRLNRLQPAFFVGGLAALGSRAGFDLALVNMLPEEFLPLLRDLARLLRPGGEAILSGIVRERREEVVSRLVEAGFGEPLDRFAGGWAACRMRRLEERA